MDFETLMARWTWRPIRNCPGRFALAHSDHTLSLAALVGADVSADEFNVSGARDTVLVLPIAGGGLISYRREDGTYLHTLNTPEGFERKLSQLGIGLRTAPAARGESHGEHRGRRGAPRTSRGPRHAFCAWWGGRRDD